MCVLLCKSHHYASPELFLIFKNSTPCTSTSCFPFLPPYGTPRNHILFPVSIYLTILDINVIIQSFLNQIVLLSTLFSKKIHLRFRDSQSFVLFKTEIVFHWLYVPRSVCPFTQQWTFALSPPFVGKNTLWTQVSKYLFKTLYWDFFFSVYPETNGQVSRSLSF